MKPQEPVDEKTFPFRYVDAKGQVWEGTFHYRRPGLRDLLRIEAERIRLSEGQDLQGEYRVLAGVLARLKIVLPSVPKWFDWNRVRDAALLRALLDEVERIETAWFPDEPEPRGGGTSHGAPATPGP